MPPTIDLTGKRFGDLVVQGMAPESSNARPDWVCLCSCGNTKIVRGVNLRSAGTSSCGHRQVESRIKHGLSSHPLYKIWASMKNRCSDTSVQRDNYARRGIRVCQAWQESFEVFLADVGERPSGVRGDGKSLWSLDRIDNDRGYEPGNVRWATSSQQARNRRTVADLTQEVESLRDQLSTARAEIARLGGDDGQ